MEKPISRALHGVADYSYAAVVTTAPEAVGFSENKTATTLCRVMGSGAFLYSLLTRYELGAIPILSFKTHLIIDGAANALALGAPWLFGFSQNKLARNTFVAAGLTGLTLTLLTQPDEMPGDR